jgi:hypothetical protein
MKKKLVAGLLIAGGCLFAAPRIGIGVGFGAPAAPPYVAPGPRVADVPTMPAPGYTLVGGYRVGGVRHPGYRVAPHVHDRGSDHFRR